ncbi:MAG: hypothetical protein HRT61_24150, partial [Ekhidna sp.]|nr:hypothetical protein [Ekhidna sp.]
LREALKSAQGKIEDLTKELKNVCSNAKKKETAMSKAKKELQSKVATLKEQVEQVEQQRDGYKDRLGKANAYLEDKSKGFLAEQQPQF